MWNFCMYDGGVMLINHCIFFSVQVKLELCFCFHTFLGIMLQLLSGCCFAGGCIYLAVWARMVDMYFPLLCDSYVAKTERLTNEPVWSVSQP